MNGMDERQRRINEEMSGPPHPDSPAALRARIEALEDALKMQCMEAGDIMSEVVAAANKNRDEAADRIEALEATLRDAIKGVGEIAEKPLKSC